MNHIFSVWNYKNCSISTEILTISTFSWSHIIFIISDNLPEKQYTHYIKSCTGTTISARNLLAVRVFFLFSYDVLKQHSPKSIRLNNWFLSFIKSHTQHSDRKASLRLLLIIFIIYGYGRWVNFFFTYFRIHHWPHTNDRTFTRYYLSYISDIASYINRYIPLPTFKICIVNFLLYIVFSI